MHASITVSFIRLVGGRGRLGEKEDRQLEGLVRKSLVDVAAYGREANRYRLHDLVGMFARSMSSKEASDDVARKPCSHFFGGKAAIG